MQLTDLTDAWARSFLRGGMGGWLGMDFREREAIKARLRVLSVGLGRKGVCTVGFGFVKVIRGPGTL